MNQAPMKWVVGGLVVGGTALIAYHVYRRWQSQRETDEGFSENGPKEPLPKKVLVLGLDGAGKTCLLTVLSKQAVNVDPAPTQGFNVVNLDDERSGKLEIWEIGGQQHVRKYWSKFIEDTSVLVFVVDATESKRFPEAYDEMHKLLGEPRLLDKPFVVLANKQDKPGAASAVAVKNALGLEDVKHHRVKVLPTSMTGTPADTLSKLLGQLY